MDNHTKPWTWGKSEGTATRPPTRWPERLIESKTFPTGWILLSTSVQVISVATHRKNLYLRRFKKFSLNREFSAPLDPHTDPASTICLHALCPTLFLCNSVRPRKTFCELIHTGVITAQAEFQSRITALTQHMVSHCPWLSHQVCWSNYRGQFVGS